MIAQLLPGVRQVRTPLVAGSLWLLVLWLLFRRELPPASRAVGLWADFYQLADTLGQPVILTALSVTAYVVGARMAWLMEQIQDFLRSLAWVLPRRVRTFTRSKGIPTQVEAAIRLAAQHDPLGEHGDEKQMRKRFRTLLLRTVTEAKFRWPAEASDLFQEYDRRESERDFAYGISAPLAALSLTLVLTEPGWTWIALGIFIVAFFSQQAGSSHQRELERFVLEAVMIGRVSTELTELLLDWSKKSGQQLVINMPHVPPTPGAADLSPSPGAVPFAEQREGSLL